MLFHHSHTRTHITPVQPARNEASASAIFLDRKNLFTVR